MQDLTAKYYSNLFDYAAAMRVTTMGGETLTFSQGIERSVAVIMAQAALGHKVMFIGNGGSAAISSHMALDFWKNGGLKAVSYNDGSLLTCIGNDFGYRHVFEKPIAMFAEMGDVLVAISSSGKSENILLGAQAAQTKGCTIVTLSGFSDDNPLRHLGEINFFVPSKAYGTVEVLHHSICHCIVDTIIRVKNG